MTRAVLEKKRIGRAAQKQETRERILNSALREFSEKGFDSASIRNISAAAGVQHGLIKYHFESKDKLWRAAVDYLFQRLFKEMEEPEEQKSKIRSERVRGWIHRYVRYCADHPEHARIMVLESIRDSDRLNWAADKYVREQHQRLIDSLPGTLDMANYPGVEASSLIYMLNAAMQAPFLLSAEIKRVHGTDVGNEKFIENYAESIFTLFFQPYLLASK